MCKDWTAPENIPRFLRETTLNAIESGVNWFTWWCSHDLDEQYSFPALEYSQGLITHDGKLKPQGHAFKELALEFGGRKVQAAKQFGFNDPPKIHDADSTWQWLDQWLDVEGKVSS